MLLFQVLIFYNILLGNKCLSYIAIKLFIDFFCVINNNNNIIIIIILVWYLEKWPCKMLLHHICFKARNVIKESINKKSPKKLKIEVKKNEIN